MKGDRLGEFEEFTLLAVHALGSGTYAVPVQQFIERHARRRASIGAVYAALARLEAKGFVRTSLGPATAEPGGRPKRLIDITPSGTRTVRDLRRVREGIWHLIEEGRRP